MTTIDHKKIGILYGASAFIFFLIGGLVVYRIGTFIPVPGIDPEALNRFFEQQSGTILSVFNMFSGGALERMSMFALGIMPYISASIILQMAAVVVTLPLLALLTWQRNALWNDPVAFYQDNLSKVPHSERAMLALASAQAAQQPAGSQHLNHDR